MNAAEKKPTILIVDDEDEVRFAIREFLESRGYPVEVASEGIGGIQRLVENPAIRTIVSDVRMPVFGGETWVKFLIQFCSSRYQVILQTGGPVAHLPKNIDLLMKPYGFEELLARIESYQSVSDISLGRS